MSQRRSSRRWRASNQALNGSRSLYDNAGVEMGSTDHFIEAAVADESVAELLEVQPGHPLLMFERLVRDREGSPLELAFTRVRGDRLTLVQNMTVSRPPVS
jgi:GntR family transcriptional regulator